jgi:hypothetical protein
MIVAFDNGDEIWSCSNSIIAKALELDEGNYDTS